MSGPVKRAGGIVVDIDDQGRYIHKFRQSTIGTLDQCLERGRLTMTGEMPDDESDAAGLGTAVHAGIEHAERAKMAGDRVSVEEMDSVAQFEFTRIMALPGFRFVKYTEKLCRRLILQCLTVFDDQLYERIDPQEVELGFGPLTIFENDQRQITITGTMDLIDHGIGMADWKTAGQAKKFKRGFGGEAWMLDRWAMQPVVYYAACVKLGLVEPTIQPFTFLAFALGATVELIETTVLVQPADIDWLVEKCLSYAALIEADLEVWPKNDGHALCSPKWCPAWATCKGKHYPTDNDWPLKPT